MPKKLNIIFDAQNDAQNVGKWLSDANTEQL